MAVFTVYTRFFIPYKAGEAICFCVLVNYTNLHMGGSVGNASLLKRDLGTECLDNKRKSKRIMRSIYICYLYQITTFLELIICIHKRELLFMFTCSS